MKNQSKLDNYRYLSIWEKLWKRSKKAGKTQFIHCPRTGKRNANGELLVCVPDTERSILYFTPGYSRRIILSLSLMSWFSLIDFHYSTTVRYATAPPPLRGSYLSKRILKKIESLRSVGALPQTSWNPAPRLVNSVPRSLWSISLRIALS